MKIPKPKDGEITISPSPAPVAPISGGFARTDKAKKLTGMGVDAMLEPVNKLMERMDNEGKSLDDFHEALFTLFPDIDDSSVSEFMLLALTGDYLKGVAVESR